MTLLKDIKKKFSDIEFVQADGLTGYKCFYKDKMFYIDGDLTAYEYKSINSKRNKRKFSSVAALISMMKKKIDKMK